MLWLSNNPEEGGLNVSAFSAANKILNERADDELGYCYCLLQGELYIQMDVYTVIFHFSCLFFFFFAFLYIRLMLLH